MLLNVSCWELVINSRRVGNRAACCCCCCCDPQHALHAVCLSVCKQASNQTFCLLALCEEMDLMLQQHTTLKSMVLTSLFFSFGSRLLLEFRVLIDEAAEYILE